jgi:sortase A
MKTDISAERTTNTPRSGSPAPSVLGVVAELCLTFGVLVALFLGYELVWTNHLTGQAQREASDALHDAWKPSPAPKASKAPPVDPPPSLGKPFAMLRIPRLGDDWQWAVIEGVERRDLQRGPGHYPDTARPGEVGNVVIAGHRATHGEPFAHLDRLRTGDEVVVETATRRIVYRVDSSEIVLPTKVGVLLPVPNEPGVAPTKARLTLVTCYPRWGSSKRMIFYTTLVSSTVRHVPGKV